MLSLGVNRILMIRDDKDKKFHEFLLKDKFKKIIIFVGILGIALIFFSGLLKTSGTQKTKSAVPKSMYFS